MTTSEIKGLSDLRAMIDGAIRFVSHNSRSKALRSVKWRLRGAGGEFVGLSDRLAPSFVDERSALVFDGLDNECVKLAAFSVLGELVIEIL